MSQISRNLTNSYENEVIREKMEEIDEMRELQNEYESDAELGDYIPEGFYSGECEGDGEYVLYLNGEEVGSMDYHDNTIMVVNIYLQMCKEFYKNTEWNIVGF